MPTPNPTPEPGACIDGDAGADARGDGCGRGDANTDTRADANTDAGVSIHAGADAGALMSLVSSPRRETPEPQQIGDVGLSAAVLDAADEEDGGPFYEEAELPGQVSPPEATPGLGLQDMWLWLLLPSVLLMLLFLVARRRRRMAEE